VTKSPSVEFRDYRRLLLRRWPSVVAGLLVGVAGAGLVLGFAPKRYVATCDVLVLPLRTDLTQTSNSGSVAVVNLDTEAQLVRSAQVLSAVRAELGPLRTTAQLADDVRVTAPASTTILSLGFPASSPAEARRGALAFAHAYLASRTVEGKEVIDARKRSLQVNIDALQTELQRVAPTAEFSDNPVDQALAEARRDVLMRQLNSVTSKLQRLATTPLEPGQIIREPALPTRPESPVPELVGPSGVMAGILVGLGLAGVRERLDRRVRGTVPAIGPLLATVHRANHADDPVTASGPAFEQARRLTNRLLIALDEDPTLRVIAVVPVGVPATGLTAQVAEAAARSGRRTLLLPSVQSHDAVSQVVAEDVPGLSLGAAQADVESLRPVIAAGRDSHDLVLVEAPPAGDENASEAQTLASWADGVLVVLAPGHTLRAELATALGQLERVGTPMLGAVTIATRR
jgi:Mrp family chromosome partitioning ATPase